MKLSMFFRFWIKAFRNLYNCRRQRVKKNKSFTNISNNKAPKIRPCCTPLVYSIDELLAVPILTHCVRCFTESTRSSSADQSMPYTWSLAINNPWDRLSNALDGSTKTILVLILCSMLASDHQPLSAIISDNYILFWKHIKLREICLENAKNNNFYITSILYNPWLLGGRKTIGGCPYDIMKTTQATEYIERGCIAA